MSTGNSVRLTIDEIEVNADDEEVATLVTDDGQMLVVPVTLLPNGARRGDVLTLTLTRDPDETEARRQRIVDLQKRLFG
jgi:hypothetical protein